MHEGLQFSPFNPSFSPRDLLMSPYVRSPLPMFHHVSDSPFRHINSSNLGIGSVSVDPVPVAPHFSSMAFSESPQPARPTPPNHFEFSGPCTGATVIDNWRGILQILQVAFPGEVNKKWINGVTMCVDAMFFKMGPDVERIFVQNLAKAHDYVKKDLKQQVFAISKTEYVNLNDSGQPDNLVVERKKLALIASFNFMKLCQNLGIFGVQMTSDTHNNNSTSGVNKITFHESLLPFLYFILCEEPHKRRNYSSVQNMLAQMVLKNQFKIFCDYQYSIDVVTNKVEMTYLCDMHSYSWWSQILSRKLFKSMTGGKKDYVVIKKNHLELVAICRFYRLAADTTVRIIRASDHDFEQHMQCCTGSEVSKQVKRRLEDYDDKPEQHKQKEQKVHVRTEELLAGCFAPILTSDDVPLDDTRGEWGFDVDLGPDFM